MDRQGTDIFDTYTKIKNNIGHVIVGKQEIIDLM